MKYQPFISFYMFLLTVFAVIHQHTNQKVKNYLATNVILIRARHRSDQ